MQTKMKTTKKSELPKSQFVNKLIPEMFETSRFMQPYKLFFHVFGSMPNKMAYFGIDKKQLYDLLKKNYSISEQSIVKSIQWNLETTNFKYNSVFMIISPGLVVYFNHAEGDRCVEILFLPEADQNVDFIELQFYITDCKVKITEPDNIHILQHTHGEYSLIPCKINNTNVDVSLHYNDDFLPVSNVIIERLNTNESKGLVLLHGKPGTGKTTYIRYLCSVLKKRVIYIPPDLVPAISSPSFIHVLFNYMDSILVIEDAENVIEERQGGSNSAISNLLNLTDGLLADCLKIQVVCSFNTDISKIDKALTRKGRLIARYFFDALKKEKAQALSGSLGYNTQIEKDMVLGDIFNQDENSFSETERRKIGFN